MPRLRSRGVSSTNLFADAETGKRCQNQFVSDDIDRSGDVQQLIAAQRVYYDLRAPYYADVTKPSDRKQRGLLDAGVNGRLVDTFAPAGDVLELACGTGAFTRELVRHADSL